VLLVLKGEDESIRLLVHPEIRTIVQEEDLAYIEALLLDFPERAKQHPADFFKQISSLGVGPLVTREVGSNFLECPYMQKITSHFIQISTTTG
jgi:hypothetical protein